MGWPQNCRIISMISGAENGSSQNTPQGGELSYNHILKINKRSGLLLPFLGVILANEDELLNAKIYMAPTVAQGSGLVFEAKVRLLANIFTGLSSTKKYSASSSLCRNQSLETVQGGYYWGFKEIAESSGGNKSVVPNTGRTVRQYISYPKGYHGHHTSFGDLAVGQGPGPNQNRKWDDDVSDINLVCDTHEIPFDAYFGPTTFSVKHDSLFYWQARYLIDEINGIPMPLKTINRIIQGNSNGAMCPGDRRTFYISNPKNNQTFFWSTSHSNITIVSGQGTSSIEIEYTGGSVIGQTYIQCQSTHACYNINISNRPLNNIAFTNGAPSANTLVPLYSTEGYSNWLQDVNCLKTYTFPGFYSGEISLSDPVATSFEWTYVNKYPSTAHVSISYTDPRYATVTVKPSGAWVIYRLTISNACGSYSHDYKFVANGICVSGPERFVNNNISELSIVPNPVLESFTVSINSIKKMWGINEVIIKNTFGNVEKRILFSNNNLNQFIYIGHLPSGVYLIQVFDGRNWFTGKVIKQ